MKRALAFAVVALFIGLAGLGQISGTWKGKINLLPAPVSFSYTSLELKYTIAGFELTSYSKFTSAGFTEQKFEISGTVGPADVSGVMGFDPSVPAYAYTDISSSLSFGGVDITTGVFHGIYPYGESYFENNYPYKWEDICQTAEDAAMMFYTLKLTADPLSITAHFSDCCTGIAFYDLTVKLSDISLCCGISYDAEVYFTKKNGFEYAEFDIDNLFSLCCGISFSASVRFGVDYKMFSITPSWEGIEGCVTVYGDVEDHWTDNTLSGWELKAWKIYCEFAECNKLTIVTATDPEWYNKHVEKGIFKEKEDGYENEYIKVETCGAGCCGGNWNFSAQAFFIAQPWTSSPSSTNLFGLTRVDINAEVPVMSNFSVSISMELPGQNLSIGWSFSF